MGEFMSAGDFFGDLLDRGVDLGEQYLKTEIAENGNQTAVTRPDTEQVASKTVQQTASEANTQKLLIGGGVLVAVLLTALVVKAVK